MLRFFLNWIWTVYTTFHSLCYRTKIHIVCQKGIDEFQTLCVGFKVVEIINLFQNVPCWMNKMGFNLIELCSNLISVWVSNIPCGPLLQHSAFKITFVRASNATDQMLCCCIAVFQYPLYYLQVWGISWCFRNALRCITYHPQVASTHKQPSVTHGKLQESARCKYMTPHVWVTKSLDTTTAGDHHSRCRHCWWLQLPLHLSLISFWSSHLQWICTDHAGFLIRDGGRQVFKTAERSGSVSNARCRAGDSTMP